MARKKTPAQVRADLTRNRRQAIGSPLAQLQFEFLNPESMQTFLEWRNNPVTLLMIDALRELSSTPPAAYIDTGDIGAQYGVSSALSFAASFVSDPKTLYPHLFSGVAPDAPQTLPEADYATTGEVPEGV